MLWVQDPCSKLTTQQAPGAGIHPEQMWMLFLSQHFHCCSFHSPMGWDFSRDCLPALPRKRSSTGESGMSHQPPLHQGGVQHPPHITVPSLPLLPQKEPVMSHRELVEKKKIWFGKILDHIKIQVALSELENQVLYISLQNF